MKTKTVRRSGNNFSLSVDFISLTYAPEVHWFRIMEGQTGETAVNNEINRISYAIVKDNITFSIPSYMYVNSWYDKLFYRIYNNYMNIKKMYRFYHNKKGFTNLKVKQTIIGNLAHLQVKLIRIITCIFISFFFILYNLSEPN